MRNWRWILALVPFLVLLAGTAISEAQTPQIAISGAKAIKLTDRLFPGDTVVQGKKKAGGDCYFEEGTWVSTEAPRDGQGKWLLIEIDDNCRAKVKTKWRGRLEDGPPGEVRMIKNLLQRSGITPVEPDKGSNISINAISGTKTSHQQVFTHGVGGTWDMLTMLEGKINFSFNGSTARINHDSGSCWAATWMPGWDWVIDYCARIGINYGPSSVVWRNGRGDYHCAPTWLPPCVFGSGYYHKLYDRITGYYDGRSYCTFSWSGTIVRGPVRRVIQGCG